MLEKIDKHINNFYNQNLETHGNTAQGVGWKNQEAQQVRFDQLAKLFTVKSGFSLNDLGCGTGDLVKYLFENQYSGFEYTGYDMLERMVQIASDTYADKPGCTFRQIGSAADMAEADYTVASGIFNIRYTLTNQEWLDYILQTISQMNAVSRKGFAFNALTAYSDADKMQIYLCYSDPLYLFDYCKKNFSRNVALLHDYNQYDFTILVRKQ
jgi:SAM-dependent methyltransferase